MGKHSRNPNLKSKATDITSNPSFLFITQTIKMDIEEVIAFTFFNIFYIYFIFPIFWY